MTNVIRLNAECWSRSSGDVGSVDSALTAKQHQQQLKKGENQRPSCDKIHTFLVTYYLKLPDKKKRKKKLFLKKDLRLSIPAVNKKKGYLRIYGVMWFHSKCKIHAFLVAELRWINTSSCHRIRCLLETTWRLMKRLLFCTVGQWHISGDKKRREKHQNTRRLKKTHTPYNWCLGDIRTCRNGLTGTSKRGLVISAGSLPQSYMHKYSTKYASNPPLLLKWQAGRQ